VTTPSFGQPGGTGPNPLVGLPAPAAPVEPFQLLATTGPAGYALVNGTGAIISWTAPGDGNLHRIGYVTIMDVTSAQTGGAVQLQFTDPAGNANFHVIYAGALGTGDQFQSPSFNLIPVAPGTTVTIAQSSAQTAGAAKLWAELWGS
jgi:hypothetical protein